MIQYLHLTKKIKNKLKINTIYLLIIFYKIKIILN
jgi:hypothetical protein